MPTSPGLVADSPVAEAAVRKEAKFESAAAIFLKAVAVVSMSNPAVAPCMPRTRKTEAPRSSSSRTVKFFSDAPGIAAIFSRTSLTVASEAGSILTEAEVTNALSLALDVELDIWTTRSLAVITPRAGRSREYFPPEVVVFARAETCEPESLIRKQRRQIVEVDLVF